LRDPAARAPAHDVAAQERERAADLAATAPRTPTSDPEGTTAAAPAARQVSIADQFREFLGALELRQILSVWLEEWLGALARPIPSFVGYGVRYLVYRLLFRRLDGFCMFATGVRFSHAYGIAAGRNFRVNTGSFVDGRGGLTVGANVLVGPNVAILSSDHEWTKPGLPIYLQGHRLSPTTIGDDVWIGANAVITPGVTLATGTLVGAGAVVTADTEPYSIVAGVPARAIGSRPNGTAAESQRVR
jgi:acetyltransferase-like isoleucine patch superfamily enzyme